MNLNDTSIISMYAPDVLLSYSIGSENRDLVLPAGKTSIQQDDLNLSFRQQEYKNGKRWQIFLDTATPITIQELSIKFIHGFQSDERVFMNGYQSWTDSMEFPLRHIMKNPSPWLKPLLKNYQLDRYGDYTFVPYSRKHGCLHGFTYAYIRQTDTWSVLFASLNEANGFTIIKTNTKSGEFLITKDLEGVHYSNQHEPYKSKPVMDILVQEGSINDVITTYFELLEKPRLPAEPCTGWTSWYNYYQNISEKIILDNLNAFKTNKLPITIFQIDDGYQTAVGDWLSLKPEFSGGMQALATAIREAGYTPGLWLAPLVCETKSKIFQEHQDWLMRNNKGSIISCGGNWSGFYTLDFYKPEVRNYLKEVFTTVLNTWGFELVKLDFLYAACIEPVYGKSRGELMEDAMKLLRELVGSKKILGCGVPLWHAFGTVEFCRIGPDIDLQWDNNLHRKIAHRERPSTLNAIQNTIGRYHLDKKAFINDPDVFLLRSTNLKLSKHEKFTLILANATLGNVLFTSDNLNEYTEDQWKLYLSIFPHKSKKIFSIRNRGKLTEIVFSIDEKQYTALFNLDKHKHAISLQKPCFMRTPDGWFYFDKTMITIPAHSSVCLFYPNNEAIAIIGSTCSLYAGSEVEKFKYEIQGTHATITIELHSDVLAGGSLFIRVPELITSVQCNGQSLQPEKLTWYNGNGNIVSFTIPEKIAYKKEQNNG